MSSDKAIPAPESKDTGFIPGDDRWTRWRNRFAIMMGRMSPEGQMQYLNARDDRMEESDCKRCEQWRDECLAYSPIVVFMREKINTLGSDIHSQNVRCRRCPLLRTGGFDPRFGIQICANTIRKRAVLEDTLAHEMMHAYDHLRFKVDRGNLRHAACTEIRACALSGECRWTREFYDRGQWNFTQQHQECVRRRAILSVAARPYCRDQAQAAKAVNEVWESCYADTRPFDEIYR